MKSKPVMQTMPLFQKEGKTIGYEKIKEPGNILAYINLETFWILHP